MSTRTLTRTLPPFNDGADYQSGQPFDAEEYNRIKELWLDHIAAEHRGDIPGLFPPPERDAPGPTSAGSREPLPLFWQFLDHGPARGPTDRNFASPVFQPG